MGAAATRITAEDFLTPPELAGRRLAADGAGRIGGVRVELLSGPGGTTLGASYQQVPLRLLPPFRFGADRPSLLYLLNPTAGLLEGDGQLVEITARAGSRAVVVGQSATRVHPCPLGFSSQQWRIRVESGAVLAVLPGPVIPFRGSRSYQRVAVDLEPGAGFVWGDQWLAGRYGRGELSERFQFTTLVQELTVRRTGRLVFRDRFAWQGPWDAVTAAWYFGPAPAAGSLFATGAIPAVLISGDDGCDLAPFPTAAGDTCLRGCGTAEAVIAGVVRAALRAAAALDRRPGDGWLPADALVPSHWFSPGVTTATTGSVIPVLTGG